MIDRLQMMSRKLPEGGGGAGNWRAPSGWQTETPDAGDRTGDRAGDRDADRDADRPRPERRRREGGSRRHAPPARAASRGPFALSSENVRLAVFALLFISIAFFGGSARADVNWLLPLRPICLFAIAVLVVLPLRERAHAMAVPAVLLAALALSIAVQLVPLPPEIWTSLPGRARFAEAAVVAGLDQPWRPVSLVPWLTWNSLFALLPALAVMTALWGIGPRHRDRVILGFLAFLGVSILLGIAQVAGALNGPPLHYRFFAQDSAIGFFANRNHAAAVLATGFPVLRLWSLTAPQGRAGAKRRIFTLVAALVLLVMIVVTGSRTGMLVGFAAFAASLAMAPLDELGAKLDPRKAWMVRVGVVAVPLLVVVLLVLFGKAVALDRIVDDDLLAEQRVMYLPLLLDLMRGFLPFGSGFGTFDPVYRSFEPDWAITTKYLNHAHNDLLELLMTGGVFALAVLAAFIVWIAVRLWKTRSDARAAETISVRAGAIMAAALLGASLTDYPLRTPIAGAVLVLACWLIARPLYDMRTARPRSQRSGGRR